MIQREEIRAQFPALKSSTVFLDNAGGSQLPEHAIRRMHDYMVRHYVQVGADYEVSIEATATIERARQLLGVCLNGRDLGKVIMGPSTSALCQMLADCYRQAPDTSRKEIVICQVGHEANVGPWVRLENSGYKVKTWRLDPGTFQCSLEELESLVTDQTRIVAFPHVSNLLGEVVPAKDICAIAHQKGARVVIDGVAYAPHRAIDVADMGADYYVFSTYKVFGPHMAALFGTHDALAELTGPNHYFIDKEDIPYKFELGGVLHEGCAGVLGLWDYFCFLTAANAGAECSRPVIEKAYNIIENLEHPLTEKMLQYLSTKPEVKVIGSTRADPTRVPTISFIHHHKGSREIAVGANEQGLGIRYGHFYAHRSCQPLSLDPADGVVRVSMVHYNTLDEIERLCHYFDRVL